MTVIVIVRSSSVRFDPRVKKIADSLSKRYQVLTLSWNREGSQLKSQIDETINVHAFNMKAPIGKTSLVLYMPLFWIWLGYKLAVIRPRIIHACDLDTLLPALLHRVIFRNCKIVYDVFDRYAMSKISYTSKLYKIITNLEDKLAAQADALITVSQKLLATFKSIPEINAVIMNCPESHANLDPKMIESNGFRIVYTGAIVPKRGLELIVTSIKNLEGIELVIAGRVIDKKLFDNIISHRNVKYKGLLSHSDALNLEASSQAIMIMYDLEKPINRFAMPNKLFEGMMLGIPIISNVAPEVLKETGCGIQVNYDDIEELKSAIILLRDHPEMRKSIGQAGLNAFKSMYNWTNMEGALFGLYSKLENK